MFSDCDRSIAGSPHTCACATKLIFDTVHCDSNTAAAQSSELLATLLHVSGLNGTVVHIYRIKYANFLSTSTTAVQILARILSAGFHIGQFS